MRILATPLECSESSTNEVINPQCACTARVMVVAVTECVSFADSSASDVAFSIKGVSLQLATKTKTSLKQAISGLDADSRVH